MVTLLRLCFFFFLRPKGKALSQARSGRKVTGISTCTPATILHTARGNEERKDSSRRHDSSLMQWPAMNQPGANILREKKGDRSCNPGFVPKYIRTYIVVVRPLSSCVSAGLFDLFQRQALVDRWYHPVFGPPGVRSSGHIW